MGKTLNEKNNKKGGYGQTVRHGKTNGWDDKDSFVFVCIPPCPCCVLG